MQQNLTPKFIPPYLGQEIKSNAERKMFEKLQKLQLKNAYVLHSLGLPKHEKKIYGEIDFVVVCERGVACLEIEGGRVKRRADGMWLFTNRYNVVTEKAEGIQANELDAGVVILFGMEDIRGTEFQKYMYIAGTRARTLLIVLEEESIAAV